MCRNCAQYRHMQMSTFPTCTIIVRIFFFKPENNNEFSYTLLTLSVVSRCSFSSSVDTRESSFSCRSMHVIHSSNALWVTSNCLHRSSTVFRLSVMSEAEPACDFQSVSRLLTSRFKSSFPDATVPGSVLSHRVFTRSMIGETSEIRVVISCKNTRGL